MEQTSSLGLLSEILLNGTSCDDTSSFNEEGIWARPNFEALKEDISCANK